MTEGIFPPFLKIAPTPFREAYQSTIGEMCDTIVALRIEIAELHSALSDLSKKQEQLDREQPRFVTQGISGGAIQWTDVIQRSHQRAPPLKLQNQPSARAPQLQMTNIPQNGERVTKGSIVVNCDQGDDHVRIKSDGARKLWGTHKSFTTGEVKGVISMLANIAPECLTVERKFKTAAGDGKQVLRWWFVLRAEESVLRELEESWSVIAFPRRWKL